MSALQPQSHTPGNGDSCTYFDVEMIEKLTLLFPLFIIYTQKKTTPGLISIRASSSQPLRVSQEARVGCWKTLTLVPPRCLVMTRLYLQPDTAVTAATPPQPLQTFFSAATAASLLPRSPSLCSPPLMRNLADLISLAALLPRLGAAGREGGGGGGQPYVFSLFTSDSVIILIRVLLLIAALCSVSSRLAPASAFLPLLTRG